MKNNLAKIEKKIKRMINNRKLTELNRESAINEKPAMIVASIGECYEITSRLAEKNGYKTRLYRI